jgi:cell division protein FtsQ
MRQLIDKFAKSVSPLIRAKGARKRKAVRKPAPPRWRKPALCAAAGIAGIAIVVGGPVWLWKSGAVERSGSAVWQTLVEASADAGLTIDEVLLEGRHFANRRDVVRAVDLKRGMPILGVSLSSVRERLIANPWIADASVERRLPDTVRIRLTERHPMALWQRRGKLMLIDRSGKVIRDADLRKFRDLIILVGKDAPANAATLFAMLSAEPALAKQVSAAARIGNRRWTLSFSNGVKVFLPEADPHLAWARLAKADRRKKLLARDIKLIDMRLPDRMIIKPGALGAQILLHKGKNT